MGQMTRFITSFIQNNPLLMKLYKNVAILFGGNALSAVIGLISLAILARALGLNEFGQYTVITAYITIIDRLVGFQTWQALIHYGAKALEEKKYSLLNSLFKFGFLLDISSGAIGSLIAIIGVLTIPELFGLESISQKTIMIAIFTISINWVATPTAIFRIFDKFSIQAIYLNISALIKLSGYSFLFLQGYQSLELYIGVWAASIIVGRGVLITLSLYEAYKNNSIFLKGADFTAMFQECSGLWRFLITTNLDGIVRILRDIDIFIVHHLLGEASTGLYKIAREIARIPTQVTGPFYQAIYPELSKLTHSKNWKLFIKIMKQSSLTLGGILTIGCICFFIIGEWFTGFVFGSEYIPAFYTTLFCILSVVVWGFAQPLAPAMMALGKVNINLYIHLVTSIFYIFMLWIFTSMFQLAGAGFSLFIFYGIWSISMLISFKIQLNRISMK